jgi:CheY-like chemotaxis protein
MATILIIADRPLDRTLLTAVLQTAGYKTVEASDGPEALDALAQISPDVIISEILMPSLDGREFVQRMRAIPALARTPVILSTAMYHEREARALADLCGAFGILTTPTAPQVLLATVVAALGSSTRLPSAPLDRTDFDHEHLHTGRQDRPLRGERERMTAILDVAKQLAAERDSLALIYTVCAEARRATLSQHAIVGLLTAEGSTRDTLYTSGLDDATTGDMKPPSAGGALLTAVVRERRPVRTRNPEGLPEALGLPAAYPTVSSLLSVPIASSSRVYGWLSLGNKLGTDEFTEVDERVAVALGAHAGIAYENVRLFDELRRRVTSLEQQLRRTSPRVREEERAPFFRTLDDQVGQILAGLTIDLHWVAAQLPSVTAPSRKDIGDRVDSILQRLDETINSVRTTASEPRDPVPQTRSTLSPRSNGRARNLSAGPESGVADPWIDQISHCAGRHRFSRSSRKLPFMRRLASED